LKAIVEDGKLYGLGSNDAGGLLGFTVILLSILCCKTCLKYCYGGFSRRSSSNGLNSVLKAFRARMCHCGRTYFDAIGYSRKGLIVLDVKIKGHQVTLHIKMTTMLCTKRFR
jgi:acetylornithine deacetylase